MAYSFVRFGCALGLLVWGSLTGHDAQAQQPVTAAPPATLPPVPAPAPVFLLNERLIIGDQTLRTLEPRAIQGMSVYKGTPDAPARWRSLAAYGIVAVTLKPDFKLNRIASRSQAQLRRGLGLGGDVRFELEGRPLTDSTLRVASADIAGLDVRRAAGQRPVVSIRLVRLPPPPRPPGTIMIRGLARD